MSEERSALEDALDLLIYAPVGLAITAAEELPKLAAKGRAQVQGQITIARMVGQFAVNQGRKEIERRLRGGPSVRAGGHSPTERAPEPTRRKTSSSSAASSASPLTGGIGGQASAGSSGPEPSPTNRKDLPGGTSPRAPGLLPGELAIPGYDSLSASQVIQRLEGLSGPELAAVEAYEAEHRGRRTILSRIHQLRA